MSRLKIAFRLIGEACRILLPPIFGALISLRSGDWTWFARAGALMVAISVADFGMSFVSAALSEIQKEIRDITEKYEEHRGSIPETYVLNHIKRSYVQYGVGFVNAFAGTLIWGFGDLIGKL